MAVRILCGAGSEQACAS